MEISRKKSRGVTPLALSIFLHYVVGATIVGSVCFPHRFFALHKLPPSRLGARMPLRMFLLCVSAANSDGPKPVFQKLTVSTPRYVTIFGPYVSSRPSLFVYLWYPLAPKTVVVSPDPFLACPFASSMCMRLASIAFPSSTLVIDLSFRLTYNISWLDRPTY